MLKILHEFEQITVFIGPHFKKNHKKGNGCSPIGVLFFSLDGLYMLIQVLQILEIATIDVQFRLVTQKMILKQKKSFIYFSFFDGQLLWDKKKKFI